MTSRSASRHKATLHCHPIPDRWHAEFSAIIAGAAGPSNGAAPRSNPSSTGKPPHHGHNHEPKRFHCNPSNIPQGLKPRVLLAFIAAVNRCATQNLVVANYFRDRALFNFAPQQKQKQNTSTVYIPRKPSSVNIPLPAETIFELSVAVRIRP